MKAAPVRSFRKHGSQIAWDLGSAESAADKAERETRMSDLILFAVLPFAAIEIPGVGLPLNEVALGVAGLLAALRTAKVSVPAWFTLLMFAVIVELAASSVLNELDSWRRLAHIALYVGLALLLAFGRISPRSAATGLGLGLILVSVLAFFKVGGDPYPGRLTGFMSDPNVAAYFLTVLGPIAIGYGNNRRIRQVLFVLIPVATALTFSRTGLLALGAGVLWIVWGKRLGLVGGGLMVSGLVWLAGNLPDDLRLFGPFADRSGSDALRERILAAERELLDTAPIYGHGPGTSIVNVMDLQFYFHNSYLATRNEGGYLLLALILGLVGFCFLSLVEGHARKQREAVWVQAALLSVLVMAINLGEVFLEIPTGLALGYAMVAYRERPELATESRAEA